MDYSKNKKAQGFIKSAKSMNMPVRQEGDEIIAYPNKAAQDAFDKKNHEAFHSAAGTKNAGMYNPSNIPTPFQMVGNVAKSAVKGIGRAATKVATVITSPTVRAMKNEDAKMAEYSRKAKSGEFNK